MAQIYNPLTQQRVDVKREKISAEDLEKTPTYEAKGFIGFLQTNPGAAKLLIVTGMMLAATLVSRGIHDIIFGSNEIQEVYADEYRDYNPGPVTSFFNSTVCKGRQGSEYCE